MLKRGTYYWSIDPTLPVDNVDHKWIVETEAEWHADIAEPGDEIRLIICGSDDWIFPSSIPNRIYIEIPKANLPVTADKVTPGYYWLYVPGSAACICEVTAHQEKGFIHILGGISMCTKHVAEGAVFLPLFDPARPFSL